MIPQILLGVDSQEEQRPAEQLAARSLYKGGGEYVRLGLEVFIKEVKRKKESGHLLKGVSEGLSWNLRMFFFLIK